MVPAVIILAVAALVLLSMWLRTRAVAKASTAGFTRRLSEMEAERDTLRSELAEAEADLSAANEDTRRLAEEVESLKSDLSDRNLTIAAHEADLEASQEQVASHERELADRTSELAARDAAMEEQSAQMAALVDERSELQSRLDQLGGALTEASARPDFKLAEAAHSGIVEPLTLWELEKARAERRWRHAVATNPESDPSPFDEPGVDPVRLAIEVEAAALREEVGAFITVDWQAEPITDPARCHLILRVAQEILASAAREPEATRLLISGDDEISMKLTAADEGNEVINLIAPRIPSDLVDISDQNGLDIVVRAK